MEHTRCHFLNTSDAESVDENDRPREISAFSNLLFLTCGGTEAAEVKVNIELRSSGLLCNEYLLHNNPEEYISHLLCSGSLKSHKNHCNFIIFKTL